MIWWIVAIAASLLAAGTLTVIGSYFAARYATAISEWLHKHNLQKSLIMTIYVKLERLGNGLFRSVLIAQRKGVKEEDQVKVEYFTPAELPEEVRREYEEKKDAHGIYSENLTLEN